MPQRRNKKVLEGARKVTVIIPSDYLLPLYQIECGIMYQENIKIYHFTCTNIK